MIYLCNAISLHMLKDMRIGEETGLRIERISAGEAGDILRKNAYKSYFGHDSGAYHLSRYLRTRIKVNRGTLRLTPNDMLIVASVESKRRVEAGYKIAPKWEFFLVQIEEKE